MLTFRGSAGFDSTRAFSLHRSAPGAESDVSSEGRAAPGGLLEAILDLQAHILKEFSPDFLLVDSRTGITELGGLATSILADRVVCLTTTAPESVDGTRVVADALRKAPRLSSQDPVRLDFLITRVPADTTNSSNVARLKNEFGDRVAVLPHDSGIATEEQVISGWRPVKLDTYRTDDDKREAGTQLFSATLDWIAESFPGHKPDADAAKNRMQEVREAWYFGALQNAFEVMADKQTPAFRTWRQLQRIPLEDVRSWFLSVRRGIGTAASFAGISLNALLDES